MLYKIRKNKGGSRDHSYDTFTLTLPANLAKAILDKYGDDAKLSCEPTEEGILYRVHTEDDEQGDLPEWLQ